MARPSGSHRKRDQGASLDQEAADRRRALSLVPVSRETEARLAVYAELLRRWQGVKNLVGPSTLGQIWTRHIADSAQLIGLVPNAKLWADMGSGAGFPGMVTAIQLRGTPDAAVHLIESNSRKCAFLREVARECEAPAIIHNARVEDILPSLDNLEVVTARAVAPLPQLLAMARVALARGACGMFLKSEGELGAPDFASADFPTSILPSKTSRDGRIVLVSASRATGQTARSPETKGFAP